MKTGTSMASPLVAGQLLRIWEDNPDLTAKQVIAKAYENKVTYQKPPFWDVAEGGYDFAPKFDVKSVPLLRQQALGHINLNLAPTDPGYYKMPLQQSIMGLGVGQTVEFKFNVAKTSKGKAAGSWMELVFASHRFPPDYNVKDFKNQVPANKDMSTVIQSCPIDINAAGDYWIRFKRLDSHSFKCEYGPGDIPGIGAKEVTVVNIYSPSSAGNTVPSSIKFMGMRAAANVPISVTNMQLQLTGIEPAKKPPKKKKKKKRGL